MSTAVPEYHANTTHAVLDALADDKGVIHDRPLFIVPPTRREARKASRNKKVVVKQPPVGKWKCDSCKARGEGPDAVLKHNSKKPDHKRFSFVNLDKIS
jgi:hypothetical protein